MPRKGVHFLKESKRYSFEPKVYGVGILGIEKTRDDNGVLLKSYSAWSGMLSRCYNEKYQQEKPTYKDCTVCDEWLYYPNFKKWFYDNYYEIDGKYMNLDKDILVKGNKVYSPDTCVFVPNNINMLFVTKVKTRGDLPIGVSFRNDTRKYTARCKNIDKKYISAGSFDTPEEAFYAYKKVKEQLIKQVADLYKENIPRILYEAMYRYEVEIND